MTNSSAEIVGSNAHSAEAGETKPLSESACAEITSGLLPSARKPKLVDCVVETYTDIELRAVVRGHLKEVSPGVFRLVPFYFKLVSGPKIEWVTPSRGEPIAAFISFDDAHHLLRFWANQTVAAWAKSRR